MLVNTSSSVGLKHVCRVPGERRGDCVIGASMQLAGETLERELRSIVSEHGGMENGWHRVCMKLQRENVRRMCLASFRWEKYGEVWQKPHILDNETICKTGPIVCHRSWLSNPVAPVRNLIKGSGLVIHFAVLAISF